MNGRWTTTFFWTIAAAMVAMAGVDSRGATPPAKKPNFLIIVADDMGYSDPGCYGGEIQTPNIDTLAAGGLRFTQFYNTARCWPTRACILTGYYAQQVRMDPPKGRLPAWAQCMPQYLKPLGYRCYHSGKWHVSGVPRPVADAGFDRSYVLHDHDRNFNPRLHQEDDHDLPAVQKNSGYYTTTYIAEHAIRCLKEHAEKYPDQPFLEYLAFTVPHFPLQAPPEDIARYRDRYLQGWDVMRQQRWQRMREMGIVNCALSALEPNVPRHTGKALMDKLGPGEIGYAAPWNELTDEQKRFQATKMAIHAAMVDRMDREIGRVIQQVRAMGALDNTVIFFFSDNGASAEILVRGDGHDQSAPPGSAASFLCLGPGFSSFSNTPFRRHKIWVHEGGIATPLVVHWPAGISARGELRHDVGHVIDLLPTVMELAGVPADRIPLLPGAPPLPGRSLVPAFARDGAVKRDFVFFSHQGNRAIRMGDWKLVSAASDDNVWELYDLSRDRCEMNNLASAEPERVKMMAQRWTELEAQFRQQAGPPQTQPATRTAK